MRSNSKKNVGKTGFPKNITTNIDKMKEKWISDERYEKSATPKSSVRYFKRFLM